MRVHRLLVANRGEIAARLIRTCRRLGIEAVLAASEPDLDSVPARLADEVVRLGPAAPEQSYLSVEAVVSAALACGADAVHPGYGFLSENPALSEACAERGICFVGPPAPQLSVLGDKLRARAEAEAAGIGLLPGGEARTLAEAERLCEQIGLPVLVKAVAGGGGRGMRLVRHKGALGASLETAMAEAAGAFGDPRVYLEAYLEHARHVEVQVLGDGRVAVHLGDRDCSVQRRHQKLVEEAPAPLVEGALRSEMRGAAVRLARRLGYRSLGTVELLLDSSAGRFFFLEVNARIQVEHPVTEEVTGLDLVAEQIAVAEGVPLRLRQEEIELTGHAVEARINAEDPSKGFRPSPGRVRSATLPAGPGIRVDSALQAGTVVPAWYDSLVAKIIASGPNRHAALGRLSSALERCRIEGIHTTTSLQHGVITTEDFRAGGVDTQWLERFLARDQSS